MLNRLVKIQLSADEITNTIESANFFKTFTLLLFTIKPEIEMKKNRQMAEVIPKHFGGLSTNPWAYLFPFPAILLTKKSKFIEKKFVKSRKQSSTKSRPDVLSSE